MIARLLRILGGSPGETPSDTQASLRGVPTVRRLKTYQAGTGYTWTYFYEGFRDQSSPVNGRAFEFTLQSSTAPSLRFTVLIPDSTGSAVAEHVGREVAPKELYALAKMHLFSVLDRETVLESDGRTSLACAEAMEIWKLLDL